MDKTNDNVAVKHLQARFEAQAVAQALNHEGFLYLAFDAAVAGEGSEHRSDIRVTASFDPELVRQAPALVAGGITDVFTPYVKPDWPFLGDTAIRLWPLPLFEDQEPPTSGSALLEIDPARVLGDLWRCVVHGLVPLCTKEDLSRYWLPGHPELWNQAACVGKGAKSLGEVELQANRRLLIQLRLLYSPDNQVYDLVRFSLNPRGWLSSHGPTSANGFTEWSRQLDEAPSALVLTRLVTLILQEPERTLSQLKRNDQLRKRLTALLGDVAPAQSALLLQTLSLYGVPEL